MNLRDDVAIVRRRRIVSVLFADIVDSTRIAASLDPEIWGDLSLRVLSRIRDQVLTFGGRVEKFAGDAVLAVFGHPVQNEDDARRAALTAVHATRSVAELSEQLHADHGIEIRIRCGITTGLAFLAEPTQDQMLPLGDVVNVAARLQQLAAPDEVLLDATTAELIRDSMPVQAVDGLDIRGRREPLRAFRILDRDPTPAPVVRPRFVGRNDHLQTLAEAFREVRETAMPRVVVISGEAGIGKSRLLDEFRERLDADRSPSAWLVGRCLPYGDGRTLGPIADLLIAATGIDPGGSAEDLRDQVDAAFAGRDDGTWLASNVGAVLGVSSPDSSREEAHAAWTRCLEIAAAHRPTVIVVEDLQWASPAVEAFVKRLPTVEAPVLLICTSRDAVRLETTDPVGPARSIAMLPLDDRAVTALVAEIGGVRVDEHEAARIVRRSGGNPLFVIELTRPALSANDGPQMSSGTDPPSLLAILGSRIDRLPEDEQRILEAASVLPHVFDLADVVAILATGEGEARRSLDQLRVDGFIQPVGSGESGSVQLRHDTIREIAYERMTFAERAALHLAAARWAESVDGETNLDAIAHHHESTLEILERLGDRRGLADAAPAAIEVLLAAAERGQPHDPTVTIRRLHRVLRLEPLTDLQRARALASRGHALMWTGSLPPAIDDFEAAADLYVSLGDLEAAAAVVLEVANCYGLTDHASVVAQQNRRAMTLLEDRPWSAVKARAWGVVAESSLMLEPTGREVGVPAFARRLVVEAERRCSEHGVDPPAALLSARAYLSLRDGDRATLEQQRLAAAAAERCGDLSEMLLHRTNLAVPLELFDGPRAALDELDHIVSLGMSRGDESRLAAATNSAAPARYALGRWDSMSQTAILGFMEAVCYRALVALDRQGAREARLVMEQVEGDVSDDPVDIVLWLATSAAIAASAGEYELARTHLEGSLDLLGTSVLVQASPAWIPIHARSALAIGHLDFLRSFGDFLDGTPDWPYVVLVRSAVTAMRAEATDRTEEAAALFDELAHGWRRFGVVPETGHSLLGVGRCLVGEDDDRGRAALIAARRIFDGLGATAILRSIDALLTDARERKAG